MLGNITSARQRAPRLDVIAATRHPHHRPACANYAEDRSNRGGVNTRLIVNGWPQSKLRDLLPDRMLVTHPELSVGERDAAPNAPALGA
jgi:hypothetical protein